MDLQRLAGYILVSSFGLLAIGAMTAPQGAYQGPDMPARLKAISEHRTRWKLSKLFDGLAILSPAVAFLILTIAVSGQQPLAPFILGTLGFIVTGIIGVLRVYRLAVDPEAGFTGLPPILDIPGSVGMSVGMILVGWAYLQGAFPAWIGYLSIGAGALSLGAYIVLGGGIAFYVAAVLYIFNVVAGVVIIQSAG